MVISPLLRGMFGIEWDAAAHTLSVTPHLPADWNTATLHHLPLGGSSVDLRFTRRGQELLVEASGAGAAGLKLTSLAAGAKAEGMTLRIPLPPVEVAFDQNLPPFGDETRQMKVLDEQVAARSLTLTLAAQGASRQNLQVKQNAAGIRLHTDDAKLGPAQDNLSNLQVTFPEGQGYVTKTVTISW
jgi:hypothetical protein